MTAWTAEACFQRIESNIEDVVGLIRQLTERADARFEEIDRRFRETDERFRETREHLNTLTRIVDEMVRQRPPSSS